MNKDIKNILMLCLTIGILILAVTFNSVGLLFLLLLLTLFI